MKNNNLSLLCSSVLLLILGGCASAPGEKVDSIETDSPQLVTDSRFVDESPLGISSAIVVEPAISIQREHGETTQTQYYDSNRNESTETAPETVSVEQPDDLWQHLRNSFSLEESSNTNDRIKSFELWYSKHPKYFERLSDRAYWLMPYVLAEIEKRGMPAEIALLPAVESAFRHDAVSSSHAVGLWQIIAPTGTRFGLRQDWWMDGRRDMVHSTRAALDYLDYLSREFNGDWLLAFAAYNAGEGTIRKAVRKNLGENKPADYWSLSLRKETAEYVPKLFAIRNIVSAPENYGIVLQPIPNQQTLAVVDARVQTDLTVAASLLPISSRELHALNLGYKRGVTPPTGPHNIVVPADQAEAFLASLGKLSHQQRMRWAHHEVRKGEYLGRIARKHGVTIDAIIAANQLQSNLIMPGQELKIPISSGINQFAKASSDGGSIRNGDTLYTIKAGDTLWKISQSVDASLSNLLNWNGMRKGSLLHPGQQLIIGRSTGT
jgi:membrane-bound lytic murein transglycosylase D